MFTGIIQEVGEIKDVQEKNQIKTFHILAPRLIPLLNIGDSVSVDGTCLTVIGKNENVFFVEAIPETLALSIAGYYQQGTLVNLEPAMQMSGRFHGHFVSGHVDFTAEVIRMTPEGDSVVYRFKYPAKMGKYLSLKGSITINGVSLTISKIEAEALEVSLIPHTLAQTNIPHLKQGARVNMEIDLLARYLETLVNAKEDESNYFFLKERGFI